MIAGRMQRPEYNGTTDTKESVGRRVRQWKINLHSPCRATCNFKGYKADVKSVKHCGEPPREIKMYVQRKTGKTIAKRISARASTCRTWRLFWRSRILATVIFGFRVIYAYDARPVHQYSLIRGWMHVYLYADWIDYAEEVVSRMKWERGKRKSRRTKFRPSITWECYIMYQIYASMYCSARVESAPRHRIWLRDAANICKE